METNEKTAEEVLDGPNYWQFMDEDFGRSYDRKTVIEAMQEYASIKAASERELSYQLRHTADVKAIKIWQEKTGKKMTLPDQADLCVFLMGLIEERDKEIERLKVALNKLSLMALCAPGCEGRCRECPSDVIHAALIPSPPSDNSQE